MEKSKMLSPNLLNQFSHPTPSSKVIALKAWPLLSVESKLQIIDSMQVSVESGLPESLPFWLLELALNDAAEIVRIWAMKAAYIPIEESLDENDTYLPIIKKIKNDSSDVVRAHVGGNQYLTFIDFSSISQDARLVRIRHMVDFPRQIFIECFEENFQKINAEDLIECLNEIIGNLDSYLTSQIDIDTLRKGWKITISMPEDIAFRLAKILPIKANPERAIEAELLSELPPLAKFWVLKTHQNHPTKELIKFSRMIVENSNEVDKYTFDLANKIVLNAEPVCSTEEIQHKNNQPVNIIGKIFKSLKK